MLPRAMRGIHRTHATVEAGWGLPHELGIRGQRASDGRRFGRRGIGMPCLQFCGPGRSEGTRSPAQVEASAPDSVGIARGADSYLARLLLVAEAGTAGSGHASHGPLVWAASFTVPIVRQLDVA